MKALQDLVIKMDPFIIFIIVAASFFALFVVLGCLCSRYRWVGSAGGRSSSFGGAHHHHPGAGIGLGGADFGGAGGGAGFGGCDGGGGHAGGGFGGASAC